MRRSIILALIATALILASCSEPAPPASAQTVQTGDIVSVDYLGSLENGTVFDSSEGRAPLEFQVGAGQVIPGFENGVLGMSLNETKTITIPPDQAYGQYDEARVQRTNVSQEDFGIDATNLTGELINVMAPTGQQLRALVVGVENGTVILDVDLNHPLAGETLVFEIIVRDIERTGIE